MVKSTRTVKDTCLENTVGKSTFTFQNYENFIFIKINSLKYYILLYLETGNYKNSKCTN